MKDDIIIWVKEGNLLCATALDEPDGWTSFLTDDALTTIHEWSDEHKCGLRISFDTFRFFSDVEMALFLLRWS